jgi:dTDP-4-dehydrorhamnose reductase
MRVLVTGAGGQLGIDLVAHCASLGDEVAAHARATLDVTDRDAVLAAVHAVRPDVVVHCAAWTAVDACEADEERAFAQNALAVRWVAEACASTGSHLVHVSTDYVFDGTLDRPYREHDTTGPRSVYGASKRAGELEALALGTGAAVVRTSWVCGRNGSNMVKTIMRLAAERPELAFVDDQIGHPTFTHDLAPVLRRLGLERVGGIVHATNSGVVSWCGFAKAVVEEMGLDPAMVTPISTAELQPPRPAERPANSVLENGVLAALGWGPLRHFTEPLAETVAALSG